MPPCGKCVNLLSDSAILLRPLKIYMPCHLEPYHAQPVRSVQNAFFVQTPFSCNVLLQEVSIIVAIFNFLILQVLNYKFHLNLLDWIVIHQ